LLPGGKRVLVVLFVPSVERDGKLAAFCRQMGRETNQGEIGLVIADEYFAIRDYTEPTP